MYKEYGKLSTKFYEITKPVGKSLDGDINYYYNKLKDIRGLVLDAGVGTGRMLIPFLQKGVNIEGVDNSKEMMNMCKNNLDILNIKTNLYLQDISDLSIDKNYSAIIMPTGSFCLLSKIKIQRTLENFYIHLSKYGVFIFDIELPLDFKTNEIGIYNCPLSEDEGILLTTINNEIDWHTQKTSVLNKYELIRNGIVKETEVSDFVLYWYGILEMELLLKESGFKDIFTEIGYGNNPKSSIVTFIAKK